MEERVVYAEIKSDFLDCYYQYCQNKIGEIWISGEHERGWAYDQWFTGYDLPTEKLMLEVIAMILNSGRSKQSDLFHRAQIEKILVKHSLEQILNCLIGEELVDFTYDLKLLGYLQE